MPKTLRSGRALLAALVLAGLATPAFALSGRDAAAINQKLGKAQFISAYAETGLRNIESRPPAIACRDLRAAKSDLAAAGRLAREALALIGPDMLGEYQPQRDKLNAIVKLDVDSDAAIAGCAADGL